MVDTASTDALRGKSTIVSGRAGVGDQSLKRRIERFSTGEYRPSDDRQGAAAVEMAMIMPLFLALVFGVVEFTRAIMVQQLLTSASREGARAAVLEGATTASVEAEVTNYLTAASVTGATVTCSVSNFGSLEFGDPVTVTVSVPYRDVTWVANSEFLENTTLRAESTMRAERLQ